VPGFAAAAIAAAVALGLLRQFQTDLCVRGENGCAGDARLYDKGYGLVQPVLFTARDGATIAAHVWATRAAAPAKRPAIVITNGSLQAPERVYWYTAQALTKTALPLCALKHASRQKLATRSQWTTSKRLALLGDGVVESTSNGTVPSFLLDGGAGSSAQMPVPARQSAVIWAAPRTGPSPTEGACDDYTVAVNRTHCAELATSRPPA
jgi:hypothetical protein